MGLLDRIFGKPPESQKSRNKRIFDEVFKWFVNETHREFTDEEYYFHTYCAWFVGAGGLAQTLVEEVDTIKKAWDKGDTDRAVALCELCVEPMISIWYDKLEEKIKHLQEDREKALRIAMSNVLNLLGTYSQNKIRDFLGWDIQHRWENKRKEVRQRKGEAGMSLWYCFLLISKAEEICDMPPLIDWDRQTYPITHSGDFKLLTGKIPPHCQDLETYIAVKMSIPISGVAMLKYFNSMVTEE